MPTATRTGSTTYATPSDREIVVVRIVDAPRALVFEAWTNPTYIRQWLTGPEGWRMPKCEIDLRPGGAWCYEYRNVDGSEMAIGGTVREVAPAERLVTTESWGPGWPESVNTVVFTEAAGRTTITMTMVYPTKEARDAALETGMRDGMDQSFAKLDRLLRALA